LEKYPFEDDAIVAEFRRNKSEWIDAVDHFQKILDDIA
jgi:U3 small nucleolar RNA-associated protein 14